jgi:rhamnosyltransferase
VPVSTSVSIVVRARDEAGRIARCLELVRAQRLQRPAPELIVVDNQSADATGDIARRSGARVLSMSRDAFSFGGALNIGAAAASGEVVVALSADAFLSDPDWLERLIAWFEDPGVACASGDRFGPAGEPLPAPVVQDLELARRYPAWGYSNGAGGFRAQLWRERPFREDLPGCEDKEWARHWLSAGYRCAVDPALVADHDHTHDGLLRLYRRARREAEGLAMSLEGGASAMAAPAPGLLREWWSDTRFYASPLRARLSHRRAARLLGERSGRRRARA